MYPSSLLHHPDESRWSSDCKAPALTRLLHLAIFEPSSFEPARLTSRKAQLSTQTFGESSGIVYSDLESELTSSLNRDYCTIQGHKTFLQMKGTSWLTINAKDC